MSFRLAPNSVALDDLERRNSHIRIVISPNSVAFGADYVKVNKESSHSLSHLLMSFLFEQVANVDACICIIEICYLSKDSLCALATI